MEHSRPPVAMGALKDAALAAVITLALTGPLSGIVLAGFTFTTAWERPLLLAAAVALARFVLSVYSRTRRHGADMSEKSVAAVGEAKSAKLLRWALIPLVPALIALPFGADKYTITTLILAMIYILLGLGLNVVVGLAGLLDLGFVGFYAVGAYAYALGAQYLGIGFWTALPFAACLAATFGLILGFPVLRMHGDYLAIVTLGFGEIIRLILNNWLDFTGGPNGVSVPSPTFFGLEFARTAQQGGRPFHEVFGLEFSSNTKFIFIYFVLLMVVAAMIRVVTQLKRMPLGRAWEALREDEVACRSLGINHVTIKLSAFSIGAMTAGMAGVFFASYQGFVNPTSFTFFESALILAIVVLGGLGSTLGVVLAAFFLTIMPEFLREFADYRILVFGLMMVIVMIWKPRGLIRTRRPVFTRPVRG